MRRKNSISFGAIAVLFMVLLLSSSITPMTASITLTEQPKPSISGEQPLQSETMTFTSGETIDFTGTETMTISMGNTIRVWSGVEMNFTSTTKMQIVETGIPDGILAQCDWVRVTFPIGYIPRECEWWEVVDPTTGKALGEIHVDGNNGIDMFHIDMTYPGVIILPAIGMTVTAIQKISVIEPCTYYEVHWPSHWYPPECSWWEIIDPETGQFTGYEFHVDWTNESCEFHIDLITPGPYILPFPWYMIKARMKIPSIEPCTYVEVEEPPAWYPAPCTWWELLDSQGLPTGVEFHVDWTNESCEFHIDDVSPGPFIFPIPGVLFFEAEQKIVNVTSCDWFTIENPLGYTPEVCSWWEVVDPSGVPTGIEFHIDDVGQGTFHVDQVIPNDPAQMPWFPPTVTINVVKKITTVTQCSWFKVLDLARVPTPCTWWRVVHPMVGEIEFHVDIANPDGTFHVDIVDPITTFAPTYVATAEREMLTIQTCDWFTVRSPLGYLPQPCSWWRVILPSGSDCEFHVDSTNGIDRFHVDKVSGTTPVIWNITAESFEPTLPWYMKPAYPDYAPSGMPDFDQRQGGTYLWRDQGGMWSHCGPVAVANSIWWLDSKFDPIPLVQAYPGVLDDHSVMNVQPLVEHLAFLMDTDGLRTHIVHSGTNVIDMEAGITQYLSWSGVNPLGDVDGDGIVTAADESIVLAALFTFPGMPGWDMRADIWPATLGYPPVADNSVDLSDLGLVQQHMGQRGMFYEHTQLAPTWEYIVQQVTMCQDVELLLVPYYFDGQGWYRYTEGAHYVTVAGLNVTTMEIVFSDPIRDNAEAGGAGDVPKPHIHLGPEPPYLTHNNASFVSHDMYHVIVDPCPGGPLTIPDFLGGAIPPPQPYPIWRIQIEAAVVTCPYEIVENHDVAVIDIATSKTGCTPKETLGEGKPIDINVTVMNQGDFPETFTVRTWANDTMISEYVVVDLAPGATLLWSEDDEIIGGVKGSIRIMANCTIVSGETDTADNTLVYGYIFKTLAGDVDGDRDVDIFDIVRMAGVYGVAYPNPRYDPNSDIDNNKVINIFDIVAAAGNYGKHW